MFFFVFVKLARKMLVYGRGSLVVRGGWGGGARNEADTFTFTRLDRQRPRPMQLIRCDCLFSRTSARSRARFLRVSDSARAITRVNRPIGNGSRARFMRARLAASPVRCCTVHVASCILRFTVRFRFREERSMSPNHGEFSAGYIV